MGLRYETQHVLIRSIMSGVVPLPDLRKNDGKINRTGITSQK